MNLRLGAVRRLAYEAADCGLLSADLVLVFSRTSCPCSRRARPRKWDPPQASIPISFTCRFAVKCSSCLRENFLRTTISPRRLSPTRGKTVLPRSMPIVCSSVGCLLRTALISKLCKGGGPSH
jgi:hypothetical protein